MEENKLLCPCGRKEIALSPEAQAFYDRAIAEKSDNLTRVVMLVKLYEAEKIAAREEYRRRLEAAKIRFLPQPTAPKDPAREAVQSKLMPFMRTLKSVSHMRARALKVRDKWCIEIKASHHTLETVPNSFEGIAVVKVCDCGVG